jgi:hypothetical protein
MSDDAPVTTAIGCGGDMPRSSPDRSRMAPTCHRAVRFVSYSTGKMKGGVEVDGNGAVRAAV